MRKVISICLVIMTATVMMSGCTKIKTAEKTPISIDYGRWEGSTFISEWGEFSVQVPSGWYTATDEELKLVYDAGTELLVGTGIATEEELENISYIYPMMIAKYPMDSDFTGINTNMIVFYEKLQPINVLLVNGKDYLEITKESYESMNMGYEITGGIAKSKVAGADFYMMIADDNTNGLQQVFLCRKHGGFIIGFIITGSLDNQSEIDDLIERIEVY